MVEWPLQINGHEFEPTLGDSEVQESQACYTELQRVGHDLVTKQQQQMYQTEAIKDISVELWLSSS